MMRTGPIEPRYSRVMKKQTHRRLETRRADLRSPARSARSGSRFGTAGRALTAHFETNDATTTRGTASESSMIRGDRR